MLTLKRLRREQLVALVEAMFTETSSESEGDIQLLTFCANCPDPVAAMGLILEAEDESSEELVEKALRLDPRSPSTYDDQQLHPTHPLRHFRLIEGDLSR